MNPGISHSHIDPADPAPDYPIDWVATALRAFADIHGVQVYLEPGEAMVTQAGEHRTIIAQGVWDTSTMVNVEQLDPVPFIDLLDRTGLPTDVLEIEPGSAASFDGTVGPLADEVAKATVTGTVSAVDPMVAVRS